MRQTEIPQRRKNLAAPLLILILLFVLFFLYCKWNGLGSSATGDSASAVRLLSDLPANATREEKLRAVSHEIPQAKKILEDLQSYPDEILDLLLRNPETADFVADYPQHRDGTEGKPDISGEIKKGKTPHFLQWDKRWGYDKYGSSIIAVSGCGPTCLSMVYSSLTGKADRDPKSMAEFSSQNGYYISGKGTSWSLMTDGAQRLGLNVRELALSESAMRSALDGGELLVLSLGAGDFTDSGHFIVVCGTDRAKRFRVLDPNSSERSEKTWSYEVLAPQVLNLWAFSV